MTSKPEYDFFVSYSREGREWAEWIAWELEDAGFTTRIQAWHFVPGSDFVREMESAASSCARTICVLSESYVSSDFASAEWRVAFAADPGGEKRTLIPVRTADVEIPALLRTRVYIDLVNVDEERARELLRQGVSTNEMRPTLQPKFPGRPDSPRFPPHDRPHQISSDPLEAGWQGIQIRQDEVVRFDLARYGSIGELLDDLWVFYLNDDYPAYTYGSRWVLSAGDLIVAPLIWVSKNPLSVRDIAPEWQRESLSDLGLLPPVAYENWKLVRSPGSAFVGVTMPTPEAAHLLGRDRKRLVALRQDIDLGRGRPANVSRRDIGVVVQVTNPTHAGKVFRGSSAESILE